MNIVRKLELISGVTTGALGIGVMLATLYETAETGRLLHEQPPMVQTFIVWLVLFVLPAFLVAVGGYTHAFRKRPSGRVMVIVGSLILALIFLLSFVTLVFSRPVLYSKLIVLLTVFAILTSLISLLVRQEE